MPRQPAASRLTVRVLSSLTVAGLCVLSGPYGSARAQDASQDARREVTNPASGGETQPTPTPMLSTTIPGFMDSPYGPPSFGAPYGTTHMFGSWGGIQPWLQKRGVYVAVDIYESLAGNVTGGRHKTETNAGQVGVTLDVDWQKLLGAGNWAKDFWLHMLMVNGHGRNLSGDIGDNVTQAQQIYGARGNVVAHLVWAYAEKAWFNRKVDWAIGWMPTGTFFNNSPWVCSFMNVSLCGNVTPTKYLNGGRDWPSGNIGTVLRLMPTKHLYLMGGLFAVSPHSYNGGISGWSWAQSGLGKLSTEVEAGWIPEFGRDKLIGHYKVGVMYDNSRYPDLYDDGSGQAWVLTGRRPRYQSGQTSVWVMADQMLIRHGAGPMNGLVLAGYYSYASGQTSAMNHHLVGALLDTGKLWGRPLDTWGIAFQWMNFSRAAILQQEASFNAGLPFQSTNFGTPHGIQSHENAYELFYSFHVMNGLTVQPDFQYFNRLGGTTTYKDAAVLGVVFNALL
ncbi:carbohydrate porin [Gluconobacter morbifer]|nr:carbohydrate porin [Gluconobacter morbifer]